MSRILAVVLMLVPMMISAQEWIPMGVLRGGSGEQAVASVDVQYMLLHRVLYRQDKDLVWREQSKLNDLGLMRAWGDTVVVIGEQYYFSSDGGKQWSTAPIQKGWKIMPNSPFAAFVVGVNDSLVRVSVKDPITGQLSSKVFPMTDQPPSWGHYEWFAERDRIVMLGEWRSNSKPMRSLVIQVPTIDSGRWIANQIESFGTPTAIIGGGFMYRDGTQAIIERQGHLDTINYNTLASEESFFGGWICKAGDTWYHVDHVDSRSRELYRYTAQKTWEIMDKVDIPLYLRPVGVQGDALIFSASYHGPYRYNVRKETIAVDNNGLSSPGLIFTNGRYVVTYDHNMSGLSRIALVLDRPDEPQVVFDTVVKGKIRSAELIGDVLWIAADSVYTYDPLTRTFTNEQFPAYSGSEIAYVSELPGGIGIAVMLPEDPRQVQYVRYRAYGSSTWSILARLPTTWTTHSFVGTNDGYLIVSIVQNSPTWSYYAHRYTMNGEKIGDSVNIGTKYGYNSTYEYDFVRMGNKIYYGSANFVNAVSTDQGATWTEISDPLNDQLLTPTPAGVWWAKDTTLHFSSDAMQSVQTFTIPPSLWSFCLDHHCYGNTGYGLSYIKRPAVGVDEAIDRPLATSTIVTTAQLINVLGECIGTLPVIDGQLAPFDPTTLPMQVLWAVWGEKVVRVR
jgi:hypothetical protein